MFNHSNQRASQPELPISIAMSHTASDIPLTSCQDAADAESDELLLSDESLQSPTKWGFNIVVEALHAFEEELRAQPRPAATKPDTPYIQQWRRKPELYVQRFQKALETMRRWEAYRKFDLDTIAKWRLGVGVLPSSQCKHRRLIYPVIIGGEIVGLRGRAFECDCTKWLQSAGSNAQLFNQDALAPGCVAIIVESPADVMLAEQTLRSKQPGKMSWVPIAGTAGAGTWKDEWSRLLVQKKVAGVYLWLDNDLAGDPNPKMRQRLLSEWHARNPAAKTGPLPAASKVVASLTRYGLKVDRYQWPDEAPAKVDWGWLDEQGQLFETVVAAGLAFEAKLRAQPAPRQYDAPTLPDGPLPEPPEEVQQLRTHRQLIAILLEEVKPVNAIPLVEARTELFDTAHTYLDTYTPGNLLLIKARPGVGKSTMAVKLAEWLASQGKRVLYLGPRHNFFLDVRKISIRLGDGNEDRWYEWLGRKHVDPETGEHDMCIYSEDIDKWIRKGYEGKDFCSGVCGFKYMTKDCKYHQQKHKAGRLVFGQLAHLWTGLPDDDRPFDVVIVDENPMNAMLHKWIIPAKYVMPPGMDITEPLTELVDDLRKLVLDTGKDGVEKDGFEGTKLIEKLGGVTHVREILESWDLDITGAKLQAPRIHQAGDADSAPYGHLVDLIPMLLREAKLIEAGTPGIARVVVANGNLMLLRRRTINEKYAHLPMIWLDGTAEPHICKALSGREVQVVDPPVEMKGKVYQVVPYMHGKTSFMAKDKNNKPIYSNGEPVWDLKKIQRIREGIEYVVQTRGYKNPGIITYLDIKESFGNMKQGHFGGERGTNEFEDCDAIFVVGTPQLKMSDILANAKMIFYERDEPFDKIDKININKTWFDRPMPYVGQPLAFPVGGFWNDPDLQAVLHQGREAEIEQAAHRIRPISRACDIWLITPVPIAGLPPIEVLDRHKLRDAPKGVEVNRWEAFMKFADERHVRSEPIRSTDLAADLGVCPRVAREYIDRLVASQPDRWAIGNPKEVKPGRPVYAAVPIQTTDE